MVKRVLLCCLAFSLLLGFIPVMAGEMIDNPMYKHWAKFKPGSFSTLKGSMQSSGMNSESEMTQTLKELTPQKAVVEMKNAMIVAGKRTENPPQLVTHPAKLEKTKSTADPTHVPKGGVKIASGEDTIMVKSKGVKAKWVKYEITQSGTKMQVTTWINEDIPGTLVKSDNLTSAPVKMSNSMLLVDFKADRK